MQAGLERKIFRRVLTALLLTGVLLVAGATAAGADGYGSDCTSCSSDHYGPTYPVPDAPPEAPPGTPDRPPALARTGSDSGMLLGIGAAVALAGGGLVVFTRRRRLAVVPA